MTGPRGGRIATIDGLRGIAVLLVVWFHVWQISWQSAVVPGLGFSFQPLVETGWLGVELFFFISGFVLTVPFARARITGAAPPAWRDFFVRRFLKIVPSYVLCIALLIAAGYQTYAHAWEAARDVLFHLLFVHNWFAVTNGSINDVLWSLGVEVQFYVVYPLVAVAFLRRPLLTGLAMVAIANAWRIWALAANHYFLGLREAQLPAYLDLFAAGMLCAYGYVVLASHPERVERRRWVFSLLMIGGIAAYWLLAVSSFTVAHDQPAWPEPWKVEHRTLVALAIAMTALGSLFAFRPLQRLLANPPLLFLAAISYNLYLWHQVIARSLLHHHVPAYATADAHDDQRWQLAFAFVAVPAALAVSTAITYGFERPIMRLRRRKPREPARVPEVSRRALG